MRRWDQFIRVWLCVSNFHWRPSSILGEGARFTKSGFTRVFSVLATSIPIRKSDRNRPRLSLRLAPVRASFPRSAVYVRICLPQALCVCTSVFIGRFVSLITRTHRANLGNAMVRRSQLPRILATAFINVRPVFSERPAAKPLLYLGSIPLYQL